MSARDIIISLVVGIGVLAVFVFVALLQGQLQRLRERLERRRMPPGTRFPKGGEIYEAVGDFEIHYMTAHRAPFTGGGRAILPKGERVRVSDSANPEPLGVCCEPLNYDALHERIVSVEERSHRQYQGYYFHIDTVVLNQFFRLVESPKLPS